MVPIRYIGKKNRKVDTPNIAGTGTIWNGTGDVQEVPDGAVPRLLEHTDSFELVDEKSAKKQKAPEKDEVEYAPPVKDEETPVQAKAPLIDIQTADAQTLREYAQRHFGHTFHHKAGAERMRNEIIGLMNRDN